MPCAGGKRNAAPPGILDGLLAGGRFMVVRLVLIVAILVCQSLLAAEAPRARDLGIPFAGEPGPWNAMSRGSRSERPGLCHRGDGVPGPVAREGAPITRAPRDRPGEAGREPARAFVRRGAGVRAGRPRGHGELPVAVAAPAGTNAVVPAVGSVEFGGASGCRAGSRAGSGSLRQMKRQSSRVTSGKS